MQIPPELIFDSLQDGVFATNKEREIVYWNKAAERITGWKAEEVMGKGCFDGFICHVDKDMNILCRQKSCPLHRCIETGEAEKVPIIMFSNSRDGRRVPLHISVSPVRDKKGEIIGGVQFFRDLSETFKDLMRAKAMQQSVMNMSTPNDPRIQINVHRIPYDIVSGDFYKVHKISDDQYGILLADVTGKGVAAALYTMYLDSLSNLHTDWFKQPDVLLYALNQSLFALQEVEPTFASAICAKLDLSKKTVAIASANNPNPLLFKTSGKTEVLNMSGPTLGMYLESDYRTEVFPIDLNDHLLFYTNGAIEAGGMPKNALPPDKLLNVLSQIGYPQKQNANLAYVEKGLQQFQESIQLSDDLTLMQVAVKNFTEAHLR
ncbi:SpoIIE family protein phosphatase [Candidatus Sumerlaeota bacterium]|nr:SpoIIE family protein phosphatase [Candidatus Sumerlaeota bacterium]